MGKGKLPLSIILNIITFAIVALTAFIHWSVDGDLFFLIFGLVSLGCMCFTVILLTLGKIGSNSDNKEEQ